jgi:hypothetical protein
VYFAATGNQKANERLWCTKISPAFVPRLRDGRPPAAAIPWRPLACSIHVCMASYTRRGAPATAPGRAPGRRTRARARPRAGPGGKAQRGPHASKPLRNHAVHLRRLAEPLKCSDSTNAVQQPELVMFLTGRHGRYWPCRHSQAGVALNGQRSCPANLVPQHIGQLLVSGSP